MDGAFPEESLQSVSRGDTATVYVECAQTLLSLWIPYSASSMHYPKCKTAARVKQRRALSPQSIISSLSGLAKQGDSFVFKPSCSSNSEGVGKPFLLRKGWKQ